MAPMENAREPLAGSQASRIVARKADNLDHTAPPLLHQPGRPATLMGDLNDLPRALAPLVEQARWCVWRWVLKGDKWTKPPFQSAHPDKNASSNKRSTWGSFQEAKAAVEAGLADGVGYMLSGSGIGAFDLDCCLDRNSGDIAPWAWDLIDEAASYVETTVSGTGLRIIGWAGGGLVHRKQRAEPDGPGSLETYRGDVARYIVITGLQLANSYDELAGLDEVIDRTVARLDAKPAGDVLPFDVPASAATTSNPVIRDTTPLGSQPLPPELDQLIRFGAPVGERSERFFHCIGWLKDLGHTPGQIETLLGAYPSGIAEKFGRRLRNEIERCFDKAETRAPRAERFSIPDRRTNRSEQERLTPAAADLGLTGRPKAVPDGNSLPITPTFALTWHGDADADEDRQYLIQDLIPENGKGLMPGMWGSGKTFLALNLSASVMTMEAFAGRRVERQGGVLFIAPEGASEIAVRMRGIAKKLRDLQLRSDAKPVDPARLPIAWIDQCPPLVDKESIATLVAMAQAAAKGLKQRFNLPLALVIVDTIAAASGVSDENQAAEATRVMNALESLSRQTGAFVLGVDHFGKTTEVGVRGSSAKESAADVVLACLGDRDVSGTVTNTRLAVRKLRGGVTGTETPYSLEVLTVGENLRGEPITTCTVSWGSSPGSPTVKGRWPASLRILQKAINTAMAEDGERIRPFGSEGSDVLAVSGEAVRAEFLKSYPVSGESKEARSATKRKAFGRALRMALERELVVSRDRGGTDYLWLAEQADV